MCSVVSSRSRKWDKSRFDKYNTLKIYFRIIFEYCEYSALKDRGI
jgi:hypothetical protein